MTSRAIASTISGSPLSLRTSAVMPSIVIQRPSAWRTRARYVAGLPPATASAISVAAPSTSSGWTLSSGAERGGLSRRVAENGLVGRRRIEDAAFEIEQRDHVRRAFDDGAVELLALAQILVHPRAVECERREVAEAAKQRELGPAERAPGPVRHDAEHADDIGSGAKRDAGCRPVEPGPVEALRATRPGAVVGDGQRLAGRPDTTDQALAALAGEFPGTRRRIRGRS